jgi:HEAT repeat protein
MNGLVKLDAREYANYIAGLLEKGNLKGDAAKALAMMKATDYAADIVKLLDTGSYTERCDALNALGMMKAKECAKNVAECLSDRNSTIRGFAAESLGLMGATEYAKELYKILKTEKNNDDNSRWLVRYAVWSLGLMKAKEYSGDIAKLLSDEDVFIRSVAVVALGLMDAKEYAKDSIPLIEQIINGQVFMPVEEYAQFKERAKEALANLKVK